MVKSQLYYHCLNVQIDKLVAAFFATERRDGGVGDPPGLEYETYITRLKKIEISKTLL